jgi:glycosyltransferase involved in cell wall biosynthesis
MDLFASPSPEEAFGLAAVEALAAGLPVLYASCPAIEDLPSRATGNARQVPCDIDAFARAIAAARTRGCGPRTAPDAAHHYSITRSAAQLMDVYAAAVAAPSVSPSPQGASSP